MKWFIIALVGGLGLFTWIKLHPSKAYVALLHFDRARREGRCVELSRHVDGPAKAWLEEYCGSGQEGGDALAGTAALATVGVDGAAASSVMQAGITSLQDASGVSIVHHKVSVDDNDDGSVTVVADAFGVDHHNDPANRRLLPTKQRQTVKLRLNGDDWTVLSFSQAPAP